MGWHGGRPVDTVCTAGGRVAHDALAPAEAEGGNPFAVARALVGAAGVWLSRHGVLSHAPRGAATLALHGVRLPTVSLRPGADSLLNQQRFYLERGSATCREPLDLHRLLS